MIRPTVSDLSPVLKFSVGERQQLLALARDSIEAAAASKPIHEINLLEFSANLQEPNACFVSLHKYGDLRGCTGVLVARAPLAMEVIRTACQTALCDPRFPPVTADEVEDLDIEISVLTPPIKLELSSPVELSRRIRPGIDGVTLARGFYRATFLPQVWERVPDPLLFLDLLCEKMGLPARAWAFTKLDVEVYQVEQFSEANILPLETSYGAGI